MSKKTDFHPYNTQVAKLESEVRAADMMMRTNSALINLLAMQNKQLKAHRANLCRSLQDLWDEHFAGAR